MWKQLKTCCITPELLGISPSRSFKWHLWHQLAWQHQLENLVSHSCHPPPIHHHLKLTTAIINSLFPSLPLPSHSPQSHLQALQQHILQMLKQHPWPSLTQTLCPSRASYMKCYVNHTCHVGCFKLHKATWGASVLRFQSLLRRICEPDLSKWIVRPRGWWVAGTIIGLLHGQFHLSRHHCQFWSCNTVWFNGHSQSCGWWWGTHEHVILSSLFTSSETSKLGLDPSIPGLESHLGQIITKRHEVSSPLLAPSPLLG